MLYITRTLSRKSSKAKKDSKSITETCNNNGLLNCDRVIIYLVKIFSSCKKLLEHIFAPANPFFFASSKDLQENYDRIFWLLQCKASGPFSVLIFVLDRKIKFFISYFCFLSAVSFASSKVFMYLPLSASSLSRINLPDKNKENTFGVKNERNFKKERKRI